MAATAEFIPRRAALAGLGAAALALAAVAAVRLSGGPPATPDAPTVQQRSLRFEDRSDRGIAVVDAATGVTLETLHGEQGFVRGTLRGLVRERKRQGIGGDAPLQLLARADGRLTLADPLTDRRIDLESFGASNAAVFARWLPSDPTPRHAP
jgi:putative photosynthetic complex assembly protein